MDYGSVLNEKRYRMITIDPPWPETGGGGRGAQRHYNVLRYDQIPSAVLGAPVWRPLLKFWVGIWTTKSSLPHGLKLLDACGAQYVTTWTWIKTTEATGQISLGMGQYGRHGVEFLLWGRRGQPGRNGTAWQRARADFDSPTGEHSEKPAFAYRQALEVFGGPALAMFERAPRPGFDVWGDEAPKEAA